MSRNPRRYRANSIYPIVPAVTKLHFEIGLGLSNPLFRSRASSLEIIRGSGIKGRFSVTHALDSDEWAQAEDLDLKVSNRKIFIKIPEENCAGPENFMKKRRASLGNQFKIGGRVRTFPPKPSLKNVMPKVVLFNSSLRSMLAASLGDLTPRQFVDKYLSSENSRRTPVLAGSVFG